MNGSRILELSYSDGEIYKSGVIGNSSVKSIHSTRNGVKSNYYHSSDNKFLDYLYPTFSTKESENDELEVKYYHPSNDIYKHITETQTNKGVDFLKYDLCPIIKLWVGIGTYKNDKNSFELFFTVDTDINLLGISEYYGLKYPLPKTESLEDGTNDWHSKDFNFACERINPNCNSKYRTDFKLGSIKFKNDKPIKFKVYKSNYKDREYAKRD